MIALSDIQRAAESRSEFMQRMVDQTNLEMRKGGHKGAALVSCRYEKPEGVPASATIVARPGDTLLTLDQCRAAIAAKTGGDKKTRAS